MDRGYIFLNSLVYGLIGFVFASMYAYAKMQHLGLGAFFVFSGYIVYEFIEQGMSWEPFLLLIGFLLFYHAINRLLLRWFTEQQRDLLSIVFTISVSVLVENVLNIVHGPQSMSVSGIHLQDWHIVVLFFVINLFIFYLFGKSYFARIMKGIIEKTSVIRSLGVHVHRNLYVIFLLSVIALFIGSSLVLFESSLRSSDALFYLLKGIGIAILVGFGQKQWIMIGALLYVLLEYLMFIEWGRPIVYKEVLILVIILLVLILKPSGLFSWGKRTI